MPNGLVSYNRPSCQKGAFVIETPKYIAIYSRKSRQTETGESVANQVQLCRSYALTHFGPDCALRLLVFEDEGFSGSNLNRPGFRALWEAAENRQLSAIVVYRLDRISRSINDFARLLEELNRWDVAFVSIREQFDTGSPLGRAMLYIASVFSQLERETIAERIRDNLQELAKTGRWLGGTTPTGYRAMRDEWLAADGRKKQASRLIPLPGEAALVQAIFARYRELGSLTALEDWCQKQGLSTKTGRAFTRFSLRGILSNPVYAPAGPQTYAYFREQNAAFLSPPERFQGQTGVMAYHRTRQQKGRSTLYLPPSQWIIAVGQHPPLVSEALWLAVQARLNRRSRSPRPSCPQAERISSGLPAPPQTD